MRLSLSYKIMALAALTVLIAHAPTTSSAETAIGHAGSFLSNDAVVVEIHARKKRAVEDQSGHEHDHDHDHDHEQDHDHDHDHDHGKDNTTDSQESKAGDVHDHEDHGHSHGPARTCDPHDHSHGEYILWHHIVALLVLTVIAGLGCVLPMIIRDSPRSRFVVQLGKYFGAGVVLSVALIHILPEALFSLTHPCLSKAWTDDYPGYAPLIMMVSGLFMLVIEFMASSIAFGVDAEKKTAGAAGVIEAHPAHNHHGHAYGEKVADDGHSMDSNPSSPTHARLGENDGCNHAHGLTLLQCGPGVSTKVATYMLEFGIALHSVFIGIALGVLAGSEFLAMTVAICFHQFFEGVALGSRIAELSFRRKLVPLMLVVAFALVTPLGVAIGMGMQANYKASDVTSLIVTGVFNSIACGVLLYTAFVTLLGGDILYSERFRAETRASKASYLVAVWLGALSMAVIALWA